MAKENLICSVKGCDKPAKARLRCSAHYEQIRRQTAESVSCSVSGCNSIAANRHGMCNAHYLRARRRGSVPLSRRRTGVALTWLKNALISDTSECVEWPFLMHSGGYGQIHFEGELIGAHRAACILAHGNPPSDKHQAAHSCGNRKCVNKHHLRWALPIENSADMVSHGTRLRGETMPLSKLTEKQVIKIVALKGSRSASSVAALFGISKPTVTGIWRGDSWRHVARS